MEHRPQNPEDERAEILKAHYRLDTLFDLSKDLFGVLDSELILKNLLLATMGNFGVVKGFILVLDQASWQTLHFAAQGFSAGVLPALQAAGTRILKASALGHPEVMEASPGAASEMPQSLECMIPFSVGDRLVGLMALGPKILGEPYSADEKKLFVTLRNSLVIALRNAKSFEEIKRLNADLTEKKSRLERTVSDLDAAMTQVAEYSRHLEKIIAALNVAQEVQQSLLPSRPPERIGFEVAGASLYCDKTGGDYYDYIELPCLGPGAHALVVGDVSGHGISSALLMAGVRAYLRGRAMQPGSAAEIVTDVNRLVAADTEKTVQFMTLLFLVVEAASGRLTWANAGHDPAYVYDPGTDVFTELKGTGIPLGVQPDWRYAEESGTVGPGQILLLTTDGVFEAYDAKGGLFGKERFKETVRRNAGRSAQGILQATLEAVADFRGGAPQHDDITLIVAKAKPA